MSITIMLVIIMKIKWDNSFKNQHNKPSKMFVFKLMYYEHIIINNLFLFLLLIHLFSFFDFQVSHL